MTGNRLKHWSAILFPVLVSLYLYRRSFRIWFLADDFAWLGLGLSILEPGDLWSALFSPMAQGTVRTLSERLFFLAFERGFGLESLPMRLFAFGTFAVAQVLLALTVKRLSGSVLSGVLASLLWSMSFGVVIAMNWLSSFNQILLSTLFLGAFYSFLRYAESESRGWLVACWGCYLLGFGALESIIVLPGVMLAWALLFERRRVKATLPFFVPAIAFAMAHLFWIPKAKDAPAYRMYFDSSLIESVWIYWDWLVSASRLTSFDPALDWMVQLARYTLTPALIGFVGWRSLRRDFLPLFYLLISAALIAPMLPLRDHRTDYYLASAGLGIVMILALIPVRMSGRAGRASFGLLVIFAVPSFVLQQSSIEWYLGRTAPLRPLMRGLQHAAQLHPGKLIVLEGITEDVYNSTFADSALRLIPRAEIRLVPGAGPAGNPLAMSAAMARTAFEKHSVVVYRFDGVILRDVTREWERTKALQLNSGLSPEILAGDATFSSQFVSGWYAIEDSHRWMGGAAKVNIGRPAGSSQLAVKAFAPKELTSFGFEVLQNGISIYKGTHGSGPLEMVIPLRAAAAGEEAMVLEFRSSKTVKPPADGRELSLLFTQIKVQ